MSLKICSVCLFSGALSELLFVLHDDVLFHSKPSYSKKQYVVTFNEKVIKFIFLLVTRDGWIQTLYTMISS